MPGRRQPSAARPLLAALALVSLLFVSSAAGRPGVRSAALVSGSFVDSSVADFGAGSVGSDTYLSATGDGEVGLRPLLGAEFFGSGLPSGWSSLAWSAGGSSSVAGGLLSV